jgi:hypothetical protein
VRKYEHDHQGQGLSGGMGEGLSALGVGCAPPSRVKALPGAVADAGRLSPLSVGRWLLPP